MNKIILGKAASGRPVELSLPVFLVSRLLVQASSGSGKSYLLRRLLEQTFGWIPHVVIDLEGEFHTLREKHAYVLFGGAGADHKLEVKVAEVLARRILEHGFNCILDVSELKAHDRIRFVRVFLETLIEAPRALRRPLMVVVDEAHVFCPEKGQAESAAAVIDLMSRGRKRGLLGVLATQRISKLHKDAAADAKNKLIGHASLDVDMQRAGDELGFDKAQRAALRDLDPGEFFAYGPAISRTIVRFKGGEVFTSHPEPGDRTNLKPPPAPAKLQGILKQLEDLPKQADDEAGELQRLRVEVVELRRTARGAPGAREESMAAAVSLAVADGMAKGYKAALDDLMPLTAKITLAKASLPRVFDPIDEELLKLKDRQQAALGGRLPLPAPKLGARRDSAPSSSPAAPSRSPSAAVRHSRTPTDSHAEGITRPRQAVLDALAWLEGLGFDRASRNQLGLVVGKAPGGGAFRNDLGALRTGGWVSYPGPDDVALTDAGRAVSTARPMTVDELHQDLERRLPRPRWQILKVLIDTYPNGISREALGEQVGKEAAGGAFRNDLGALRTLGLIDYPITGTVAALPVLFLEGK